jgi:hypothetical protein
MLPRLSRVPCLLACSCCQKMSKCDSELKVEFVSLSSWRTTQLTTHSPTSQPQDNPEMTSSAVHTPLLDDSVAKAAQAEALRLEGNELFKVG